MLKQISTSICAGLGDNIIARMIFDTVKHQYSQIKISHDKSIIRVWKENNHEHILFLKDIGNLLFSEIPFHYDSNQYPPIQTFDTIKKFSPIIKPNFQHLLCRGTPLDTQEEYICITTKIRLIPKQKFLPVSIQLWSVLTQLANRYKIVIMGERNIEEFSIYRRSMSENITYSIYDQIISNVPANRIIDLTVPSLGVIAPKLSNVQQDGLILQRAKFAICFGNGGNLWHAVAAANKVIAYRDDDRDCIADALLNPNFSHVKMFKNWNEFIDELKTETY
jgi:hypothetical protein